MALVGNISGSGGISNTIGITGSLIIANPGTAVFPTFPGSDVALFVSGNIATKPATSPNLSVRGTTVFGGDVVISGTLFGGSPLHIGTFLSASQGAEIGGVVTFTSTTAPTFNNGLSGSLTKLADGTSYLIAGSNVTIATGTNGAVTISSTAGGTGDVVGPASATDNAIARFDLTTGKLIQNSAVTISDESANIVTVAGSATATTINLFDTTATTVNFAGGASAGTNIGNASGLTTIAGDLQVTGNDILMSGGTTAITFSGTGDVAVAGDLTVSGNDIKANGGTTALTLAGANVTTAGNLTVTGDLTVNGTTTTIDTTNLLVEDPIILMASGAAGPNRNGGIAIFSGSADATATGARTELVFGRVANDTWGAGKFNTNNGTSTDLTGMSLLPIRASKIELGGTTSFITSSLGTEFVAQASSAVTLTATAGDVNLNAGTGAGIDILFNGTQAGAFAGTGGSALNLFARDAGAGSTARLLTLSGSTVKIGAHTAVTEFEFAGVGRGVASSVGGFTVGASAGLNLNVSGSQIFINSAKGVVSAGTTFQADGTNILAIQSGSINGQLIIGPGPLMTRTDLINTDSTTVNFAGAATALTMGATASTTTTIRGGTLSGNTSVQNIFNATATTVNFAGAGTDISIGSTAGGSNLYLKSATTNVSGSIIIAGSTTLGDATGDDITFTGRAASSLVPKTNNIYDLGTPDLRWRNMYTGDLHLKNERGDWTIIEERDYLTITNNHSGKRYKFMLQEI